MGGYPYICVYIVIHRKTVSFYQNSSVWLDTQDARSRDRNPSNFTLDCVPDNSSTKRTTLVKGNFKVFLFLETAAAFVLHFFKYPIGYQSGQFFRRALHYASGGRQFLRQRAQPPWGSMCVYSVCMCVFLCVCICIYARVYMCMCELVSKYLYVPLWKPDVILFDFCSLFNGISTVVCYLLPNTSL